MKLGIPGIPDGLANRHHGHDDRDAPPVLVAVSDARSTKVSVT